MEHNFVIFVSDLIHLSWLFFYPLTPSENSAPFRQRVRPFWDGAVADGGGWSRHLATGRRGRQLSQSRHQRRTRVRFWNFLLEFEINKKVTTKYCSGRSLQIIADYNKLLWIAKSGWWHCDGLYLLECPARSYQILKNGTYCLLVVTFYGFFFLKLPSYALYTVMFITEIIKILCM